MTREIRRLLVVASVFPNAEQPVFGTFVAERVRAYARQVEVAVVAPVPWFPRGIPRAPAPWARAARIPRWETIDGVPVHHPRRIVIPRVGGVASGALYAACLRRMLPRLREHFPYDAVDSHFAWPDGCGVVRAMAGSGVPVAITLQGTDITWMPRYPVERACIRSAIRRADSVIAVSRSLADAAARLSSGAVCPTVVWPGVDPERFPAVEREAARARLGLPREVRIIACVAHFVPRKRQRMLLAAFRDLRKAPEFRDVHLLLIGDGPDRAPILTDVRRAGEAACVHLPGAVDHRRVHEWLGAADVFALASTREGCPTVIREAMACGLPVVATDVDGSGEVIDDPRLGCLVPRDDLPELVRALRWALRSSWDRGLLRRRAIEWTWDHVAGRTLEVIAAAQRVPARMGRCG